MTTAYGIACNHGYIYIRGHGYAEGKVWFSRFTKDSSGDGPALYVGFDRQYNKWVVRKSDHEGEKQNVSGNVL